MKIRKGRKTVLTYYQRIRILQSIKYVDEVVPENDLDKIAAYKNIDLMLCLQVTII